MKNSIFLASLVALAFSFPAGADGPHSDCSPVATSLRVDFPEAAQQWRTHGTATVSIEVNTEGKVALAGLIRSSGHALLDRAALTSARRYWHFGISQCNGQPSQKEFSVTVTFERSRGMPVYGTLNRKALHRMKALEASESCVSSRRSDDATIFVCRSGGESKRFARSPSKD